MTRGRRVSGEGSIYQRASDDRWVGVIDLGLSGGRRRRKTVYGRTKREAAEKMRAAKRSIEAGVVPSDATVDQWLTHWLDEIAAKRVRDRTLADYRGCVRRYISPAVGSKKLAALTPDHVRGMLKSMEDAGLAPATRRHALTILQRALKVAVNEERVTRNAAAMVDRPSVEKRPYGSLSREETLKVLDLLEAYGQDGQWGVASRFLAALLAGLRRGEALGLTWAAVDLEAGRLHVRQSVQRLTGRSLVVEGVKSRTSERVVPLMPPLLFALREHARSGTEGFVWGGDRPMDPRADYEVWRWLLWSADVRHRPLHSARSTTANILHEARVPDRVIAAILGHANFEVTWTHYLSAEDRQIEAAMRDGWAALGARP